MQRIVTTVRLRPDILDRLQRRAEIESRSVSNLIELATSSYLAADTAGNAR